MSGQLVSRVLVVACALALFATSAALALDEKWERLAKSRDRGDRIDAVWALAKDGSESAVKLLVGLLEDDDTWVRDNVVVASKHLAKPEQVKRLLSKATSSGRMVRLDVAEALGRTKCPEVLPALRKLALEDRDAEVRRTALWALESFEGNAEALAVAATAAADTDPTIRACAVYAAGRIRLPESRKVVDAALADTDDRVRSVALYRLRWLHVGAAEVALKKYASDPSARVRSTCAETAWTLQTAPCMDVLIGLLADPDVRTAAMAHRCLRQAAKKPLDRDPELWRAWWEGAKEKWVPRQNSDPNWFWDDKYATKAQVYGASLTTAKLAVVVDVSAPQALKLRGEDTTRWDEVKGKLLAALADLDDTVEVNLIATDDEVRTAFREPRALGASARRQLKSFLDDQRPKGECDLWGALRTAFEQPGVDTVLVLSYAERGAGDLRHDDRFFEAVQRRAEMTRAVVHTVFLTSKGTAASSKTAGSLMRRIAEDTRGRPRQRTFD